MVLNNFPGVNLTVFILIYSAMIIILVKNKPHKLKIHLARNMASEICFLLIFISLCPLLKEDLN